MHVGKDSFLYETITKFHIKFNIPTSEVHISETSCTEEPNHAPQKVGQNASDLPSLTINCSKSPIC